MKLELINQGETKFLMWPEQGANRAVLGESRRARTVHVTLNASLQMQIKATLAVRRNSQNNDVCI